VLAPDDAIAAVVEGLRRDLTDPSHEWPFEGGPFDPWLARTFDRCNAEFFDGKVPPCRAFWFDALFAEGNEVFPGKFPEGATLDGDDAEAKAKEILTAPPSS